MRILDLLNFDLLDFPGQQPETSNTVRIAPAPVSRRAFLQAAVALPVLGGVQTADHGRIRPPLPAPDIKLVLNDGAGSSLSKLASGHATAVQLMFTECTTTCPIQAAIFQRVQRLLPNAAATGIQLLSLSVNPAADTPAALSAWLRRFHAGPNWIGASASAADTSLVRSFFGKANGGFADHSTQVNILDRQGRLVWRTIELPTSEEIAGVLQKLSSQ